jgi:hypothetical protein
MIYLHKNGVTIVADKKAKPGQTYELNGEKYLVVDRKMLESMVKSGKDITKVVTTRVKMMLWLFQHKTNLIKILAIGMLVILIRWNLCLKELHHLIVTSVIGQLINIVI